MIGDYHREIGPLGIGQLRYRISPNFFNLYPFITTKQSNRSVQSSFGVNLVTFVRLSVKMRCSYLLWLRSNVRLYKVWISFKFHAVYRQLVPHYAKTWRFLSVIHGSFRKQIISPSDYVEFTGFSTHYVEF